MIHSFEFRVTGFGFRVSGLWFRENTSLFIDHVVWFRVKGLGFGVSGLTRDRAAQLQSPFQGFWIRIQAAGCRLWY